MRVNQNMTACFKVSKAEIDFENSDTFIEEDCFDYKNQCFEDLRSDCSELNFKHEFRIVINEDDYDYVEDEELIKQLRAARSS